jgi:hypothetical protein
MGSAFLGVTLQCANAAMITNSNTIAQAVGYYPPGSHSPVQRLNPVALAQAERYSEIDRECR